MPVENGSTNNTDVSNTNQANTDNPLIERTNSKFSTGISVGLALVAAGFLVPLFMPASSWSSHLILIAGIATILFAFGAGGNGKFMGWTISGSAAIVIALLYASADINQRVVTVGSISGPVINEKDSTVEVVSSTTLLGAFRDRRFRFIVLANELDTLVTVYLTVGGHEVELVVPKKYVEGRPSIEWLYDHDSGELREKETGHKLTDIGSSIAQSFDVRVPAFDWQIIPRVQAFEPASTFEELTQDLDSDSSVVRRKTRSGLAGLGLPAVTRIADVLLSDNLSYRERLGVLVALTEMLRNNKALRIQVSQQLTEDHIVALAEASADLDRTIRIYAAEFLYDLADPRVVPVALDIVERDSVSDDGKYLQVFVISGVYTDESVDKLDSHVDRLRQLSTIVGPKSRELISSILGDETLASLSGRYVGEWSSDDRPRYYGSISVDLSVEADGSVNIYYEVTDSPLVDHGTLTGSVSKTTEGWVTEDLRGDGMKLDAILQAGSIQGSYSTRFFLRLLKDEGSWQLSKVYE